MNLKTFFTMLSLSVILGLFSINIVTPSQSVSAAQEGSKPKPLKKAFPNSEKCKRCHLRAFVSGILRTLPIFDWWKKSDYVLSVSCPTYSGI